MNELVLHHLYRMGSTMDLSRHNNHGQTRSVSAGTTPELSDCFCFGMDDSAIRVSPSPSLSPLLAIQASIKFMFVRRVRRPFHSLIEADSAFKLIIDDRSIQAEVLDSSDHWTGDKTAIVPEGRWTTLNLVYDGVSRLRVAFGSDVVINTVLRPGGPLSGVGSHGIVIGNSPDHPERAFSGYISEVKLYRYNPEKDVLKLLDFCCTDFKAIDKLFVDFEKRGINAAKLSSLVTSMTQIAFEASSVLQGTDSPRVRTVRATMAEAVAAFLQRDQARLAASKDALLRVQAGCPQSVIGDLAKKYVKLFTDIGLKADDLARIAEAVCIPHHKESSVPKISKEVQ
jgi:hypothetical protein